MTEQEKAQAGEDEDIPLMQQLLDSPFILLTLGVAVPSIVYTLWGVMEVVSIPVAH